MNENIHVTEMGMEKKTKEKKRLTHRSYERK